jgi:hypothetical protein
MPLTLRETPPLVPTFNIPEYDTTAASKLNPDTCDPTTMPTLTATVAPSYTVLAHRHAADVVDVHMLVLQAASATIAEIVRSFEPKLSPLTLTELPPLTAPFRKSAETTAASKLYELSSLPTTAPVVIVIVRIAAAAASVRHCTLVAELQDPVVHIAPETIALDVMSYTPKVRPLTVTEVSPLNAPFGNPYDTAGASNDIIPSPVPAAPPTVTKAIRESPTVNEPAVLRQDTLVALDHDEVSQPPSASAELAVRSTALKSSPATVTELRPLVTAFSPARDTTGASNVNAAEPVPTTAPTVTASSSAEISC